MSPKVPSSGWRVGAVTAPSKQTPANVVAEIQVLHEDGPWVLVGQVASLDGVPVVVELTLHSNMALWGDRAAESVITGELLKSIPMGRILQDVTAVVSVRMQELAKQTARRPRSRSKTKKSDPNEALFQLLSEGRRAIDQRDHEALTAYPDGAPKRGRPVSVEMHAAVARALLDLQEADRVSGRESKNLVRRLADRQVPVLDLETMRSRVKAAVLRGYLKSRGSGAEGYVPGPKLLEIDSQSEKGTS